MRRLSLLIVFFCCCQDLVFGQFHFDTIFSKASILKKISSNPSKYHLQIIYTQIDYQNGIPVFTDYLYRVSPDNYFYCASLVKLPASILALHKLNELGVDPKSVLLTDSSITCHRKVSVDTTSENGYPSAEHYIKRMLLVSDNAAFSRVYEFLGVDYIHKTLKEKGFPNVRIVARYDGNCTGRENYVSNPVRFLDKNLSVIYTQPQQISQQVFSAPVKDARVGKAYYNQKNKRVNAPRDFGTSNYLSLRDCHSFLKELIYEEKYTFNLTAGQREFLINYLGYFPRQSKSPKYSVKEYHDSYKKYLFYGDTKAAIGDTNLIITNIVGQSYGFLSDCAHFSDKKNGIEFMLSAVIYANEDEVLNDGKYDYKGVGLPYLAELGRQFYNYELQRIKR